jgi:5-formyltetrahydrofolate cyclo-ligase
LLIPSILGFNMPTTPEKAALHSVAKEARHALRGDERKRATSAVTERAVLRLTETKGLIGLYEPFGDELHPGLLMEGLAVSGRTLALPCTSKWNHPLIFRAWAIGEPLVKGRMNIPEPQPDAPEVWPDVLVVPPVAFDRRCFRIGYGAGFYDRTIPALRSIHPVFVLGVAFSCQEVEVVPDEPHDVPLDLIATERGLIIASST